MAADGVPRSVHPQQQLPYSLDQLTSAALINANHEANLAVHAAQAQAAQLRALHSAVISGSFIGGGDMICGANPPPSPAAAIPPHMLMNNYHQQCLNDAANLHQPTINHHLNVDGSAAGIQLGDNLCTPALLRSSTQDYPVFAPALQLHHVQRQLRQLEVERRIAEYYSSDALRAERINYILDNDNKTTFPGLIRPSPLHLPPPMTALTPPSLAPHALLHPYPLAAPPPSVAATHGLVHNLASFQQEQIMVSAPPAPLPTPPGEVSDNALVNHLYGLAAPPNPAAAQLTAADTLLTLPLQPSSIGEGHGDDTLVAKALQDKRQISLNDDDAHVMTDPAELDQSNRRSASCSIEQRGEFDQSMAGNYDSGDFRRMSELLTSDDEDEGDAAKGANRSGSVGARKRGGSIRATASTYEAARAIMRLPFIAQGAISACGRCDLLPSEVTNQSDDGGGAVTHRRTATHYSCMSSPLLVPLISHQHSSSTESVDLAAADKVSCRNDEPDSSKEQNYQRKPLKLKKWFSVGGRSLAARKATSGDRVHHRRCTSAKVGGAGESSTGITDESLAAMEIMELKLLQANLRRDDAIAEVSQMRAAMAEMVKKLQEVEKDCMELRSIMMVPSPETEQYMQLQKGYIDDTGAAADQPPEIIAPPDRNRPTATEVHSRCCTTKEYQYAVADDSAYVDEMTRILQQKASIAGGAGKTSAAAAEAHLAPLERSEGRIRMNAGLSAAGIELGIATSNSGRNEKPGSGLGGGRGATATEPEVAASPRLGFDKLIPEYYSETRGELGYGVGGGVAANWSNGGGAGINERLVVVVQPSKEEFAAAVAEARVAVKQLSRAVIMSLRHGHRENVGGEGGGQQQQLSYYDDGMEDMLWMMEEELEAALNRAMYENFENAGFERGCGGNETGQVQIGRRHPAERAASCYRAARTAAAASAAELLRPSSPSYDPLFDAFCARKMRIARRATAELASAAGVPLVEAAERLGGEFVRRFAAAARALWLLHLLAMSFPTPASLLRVAPLSLFDPRFMEALPSSAASSPARHHYYQQQQQQQQQRYDVVVASMLMPGFFLAPDALIKSKVLLLPPPPPTPPRAAP